MINPFLPIDSYLKNVPVGERLVEADDIDEERWGQVSLMKGEFKSMTAPAVVVNHRTHESLQSIEDAIRETKRKKRERRKSKSDERKRRRESDRKRRDLVERARQKLFSTTSFYPSTANCVRILEMMSNEALEDALLD
jgi:hypothetical protein